MQSSTRYSPEVWARGKVREALEFLQAASAMRIVHVQPARTPPALRHGEDVGDAG